MTSSAAMTLSESAVPWVHSLQFLFKSTHHTSRYERKCEWVFFFWTQCMWITNLHDLSNNDCRTRPSQLYYLDAV